MSDTRAVLSMYSSSRLPATFYASSSTSASSIIVPPSQATSSPELQWITLATAGVPPEVNAAKKEGFAGILKAFAEHSARWKRVELRLGPFTFDGEWWAGLSSEMPMLEICVITTRWHREAGGALCHVMSSKATRLRTLGMDSTDKGQTPRWAVEYGEGLEDVSPRILYQPRGCVIDHLNGYMYRSPHGGPPPAITTVPNLRILAIHNLRREPIVLDYLSFPSLTSLTIVAYDTRPIETHNVWEDVARLGARSQWCLTHLRILGGYEYPNSVAQDWLQNKLKTVPNYETVRLHSEAFSHLTHLAMSPVTNKILGALTWFDNCLVSPPLPQLYVLHLTGFRADRDVLFDMLASRVHNGGHPNRAAPRRVHLTNVAPEVEEVRQEVQARLPELVTDCRRPWEEPWVFEAIGLRHQFDPRDYW
ncbi:hypothetical protein BKA70DRAFT_1226632 [Coprinopsis sp. MPI-PUGE-AT-0042]|nr:hypothetical protein BKA70DRAFT_1226632 [Coprinopsis sp. MPI-PUGE-AT-0042]